MIEGIARCALSAVHIRPGLSGIANVKEIIMGYRIKVNFWLGQRPDRTYESITVEDAEDSYDAIEQVLKKEPRSYGHNTYGEGPYMVDTYAVRTLDTEGAKKLCEFVRFGFEVHIHGWGAHLYSHCPSGVDSAPHQMIQVLENGTVVEWAECDGEDTPWGSFDNEVVDGEVTTRWVPPLEFSQAYGSLDEFMAQAIKNLELAEADHRYYDEHGKFPDRS